MRIEVAIEVSQIASGQERRFELHQAVDKALMIGTEIMDLSEIPEGLSVRHPWEVAGAQFFTETPRRLAWVLACKA